MATSKTGSFWLTEVLALTTVDTPVAGTIDLGAYVDVGDQQALAVEEVDFIYQIHNTAADTYSSAFQVGFAGDTAVDVQLSDLNPGTAIIRADDNNLIASGSMLFDDTNNVTSVGPDLYPDTFGKLDNARMVVNDQLYLVGETRISAFNANYRLVVTARIKARIVKLATKDWMAIAIQSTASDN